MTASPHSAEPQSAEPQSRRDRLLSVATRLFAEKGFESTSVQEVVDAAGVTKGALYHYFTSKEELLFEIYGRLIRRQAANLDAIVARDAPVADRLRDIARDVVHTTLENLDEARIFVRSLHLLPTEQLTTLRAERDRYAAGFVQLVEEGRRSGAFRAGSVSPQMRLFYFVGAVHYLTVWYDPAGSASPDDVADQFAEMLLDSLT